MTSRNSAATDKALRMVSKGVKPSEAARRAGISYPGLYRALIRAGLKVKRVKTVNAVNLGE